MSARSRIMAHLVAGYPDGLTSVEVARGLADGGATYLEVQFPFSDPTADGPAIQKACSDALAAGFTVKDGFRILAQIRGAVSVPVFVMSYANLLFTRGIGPFLDECAAAGAGGVIVPDLPPGYDEGLFAAAARIGLAAVPVLSPSVSDDRLALVASLGPEFIYATLRAGTTGSFTSIDAQSLAFLSRITSAATAAAAARAPKILGGFGISTREQVTALEPCVHAVVVGSALVRAVAGARDAKGAYTAVRSTLSALGA